MKRPCKSCWDPVDKEGEELCDWCKMTPQQRKKKYDRDMALLVIGIVLVMVAMIFGTL